jgi:hypothetical protein
VFIAPGSGPSASFSQGINTAVTDASGVARSQSLTANGQAGTYQITASIAAGSAAFTLTNTAVAPGSILLPGSTTISTNQATPFPVSLSTPAPAGGVTVTLSSSDASKVVVTPNVFIAAGSTSPGAAPQITGANFGSSVISASAAGYASASQTVVVSGTLSFAPGSVSINGLTPQNVTVKLASPAPAAGLHVTLSSSNPGVATVTGSVDFPGNSTGVNVQVTPISPGSTVLTASAGIANVANATANVSVTLTTDITIPAGVIVGPGDTAVLPVFLTTAAPSGGVYITLASSDTSKVTINPETAYVPGGFTSPLSLPRVTGVGFGSATITAGAYGLTGTSAVVRVAALLSGPANLSLQRGTTSNISFVLSSPAPATLPLTVTSSNPAVASVPASLTIPQNGSIVTVPVTAIGGGSAVLHISALPDVAETTVNVTVVVPATITLSSGVAVPLGQAAPFPITLGSPAPAGGVVVNLNVDTPGIVSVSPASVFIAGGATSPGTQAQVIGDNIGLGTVTVSAAGYLSASAQVPVTASITVTPQPLVIPAGSSRLVFLALSAPAPSVGVPVSPDRAANGYVDGLTVQLTSSNPQVASVQPSVHFYSDGSSITTIVVVVNGVSPGTAILHVSALPFIPDVTTTVIVQ